MRGLVLVLVAACSYTPHTDDTPPPPGNDAGANCYGTGRNFTICVPDGTVPPPSLMITTEAVVNTDMTSACTFMVTPPDGPPLCVLAAQRVTIASRLRFVGMNPGVVLAIDSLLVTSGGSIDVASYRMPESAGAGANPAACNPPSTKGSMSADGGAGGGGGSLGSAGGAGGLGKGNIAGGAPGPVVAKPEFLRGGCRGGDGGSGPGLGGSGANGGGAIYLVSGGDMNIAGSITASGAGANGGVTNKGGGGGGGSGGMIALYASGALGTDGGTLIIANGGGGGEGADGTKTGEFGADPLAHDRAALGGEGGNGGGGAPGGDGAFLDTDAKTGGASDGGGGGGGGVGVVRVLSNQDLVGPRLSPIAVIGP